MRFATFRFDNSWAYGILESIVGNYHHFEILIDTLMINFRILFDVPLMSGDLTCPPNCSNRRLYSTRLPFKIYVLQDLNKSGQRTIFRWSQYGFRIPSLLSRLQLLLWFINLVGHDRFHSSAIHISKCNRHHRYCFEFLILHLISKL